MLIREKWRKRSSSLLATGTAVLVAMSGIVLAPTIANAAEETIDSGSLSWGVRTEWRNYVGLGPGTPGPGSLGQILGEGSANVDASYITTWTNGSGTVDTTAGTGTIDYEGRMVFLGHPASYYPPEYPEGSGDHWGMIQTYVDPQVTFTSPTTATLSFEMTQVSVLTQWPSITVPERMDLVNLTFAEGDLADGTVTSTSAQLTQAGSDLWGNYGAYVPGVEMDPVTFSFEIAAPPEATVTTTTVAASPVTSVLGDDVTLTATVDPAAEGTVQFQNNGSNLGAPVAVALTSGEAQLVTDALTAGDNSITASFTPEDAASFTPSTSTTPAVVNVGIGDVATTTTLTADPAQPLKLGDLLTLTASVTDENMHEDAAGTVKFFSTPAGGVKTKIGEATLVDGVAEVTTDALVAGGHLLTAEFTSTNEFDASEATLTAPPSRPGQAPTVVNNYGVVDPTQPTLCTPSNAETLTGVAASWDWSAYSNTTNHTGDAPFAWQKFADGNIAVGTSDTAETFQLSDGVATVGADCTRIAFEGTMRVEAYQGFFPEHGQWVELVNPELVINADGSGAWIAGVRSGEGDLNTDSSARIAIVEIADASAVDFTDDALNDVEVEFAYAGTTATGTWSAAQDSAWSNGFILQAPSQIRSFYYASGAGGDPNKPASPLTLDWVFTSTPTAEVNGEAAGAQVKQGSTATITASGFRAGERVTVAVHSDEQDLGEHVADRNGIVTVAWTVPADFALGDHQVVLTSTSSDRAVESAFEVVAAVSGGDNGGAGDNSGGEKGDSGSDTKPGGSADLAKTGSDLPVGGLVAGVLTLLAGAALMLARRRSMTSAE